MVLWVRGLGLGCLYRQMETSLPSRTLPIRFRGDGGDEGGFKGVTGEGDNVFSIKGC